MKKYIFIASIFALFFLACSKSYLSKDMGFRELSLNDELNLSLAKNEDFLKEAGSSTLLQRSYINAPAQVSHTLEGFLPITKDENTCISCHDKSIAKDMQATPIPKSHYTNTRKNKFLKADLSMQRYNCSQCHVPNYEKNLKIKNNFKPLFANEASKRSSQ